MPETRPTPKSQISRIPAYQPGSSGDGATRKVWKLSSNEAPFGPSPKALEAYAVAASQLELYPEGSAAALREAIGKTNGLDPMRIVCGSGSDELLSLLTRLYVGAGDETLMSERGFLMYRVHTLACGGSPVLVPEVGMNVEIDAVLSRITDKTRIVFLANPNNPTGTHISKAEMSRLAESMPSNVLLVIDAAYAEYASADDYEAGIELVEAHENVVMTRTFSKVHGLASLRIGWMYAPSHVVDAVNRIRGPFNMSGPAIAAGVAAIRDQDHVARQVRYNAEWRARLGTELRKMGLGVTEGQANFVLIDFPKGDPSRSADAADAYLREQGFVLRPVKAYNLPNSLRMTIGPDEANEGVLAALKSWLEG
ncbi:histidinol-phosphate transaminase [Roseicyclus sp. F158]|uniref:Histidinol-phosphate aminotransferase n=1 Tax=Tropicimonas omnivorans TaxID=3075590 RepID=A0ABU3DEQ1_9RHOB|nr:histidinol-phosphate transaminase [Roseicyclus sp. F158]MDT0682033.1 histidinol-phosphate transaminase [Roseicyclus sp. F158]